MPLLEILKKILKDITIIFEKIIQNNPFKNRNIFNYENIIIFIKCIISIAIIIIFALFIKYIIKTNLTTFILTNFINIAIILVGLTIFFQLSNFQFSYFTYFKNNIYFNKIINISNNIIFNIIYFLKTQYNITSKPITILLTIELLLICISIILPKIIHIIINHNSKILLNETVSLTKKTKLTNFDFLYKKNNNKFNYKYALSLWVYLNAQPINTNPSYIDNTNIISYGGKPAIYYNASKNELIIYTKVGNENKELYRTKNIQYQKWFNIIINYNSGIMDIFIDNKLVSSNKNVITYMTYDDIICGKQNGIYGFIKNVIYFNDILTKNKIQWINKNNKL